MVYKKNLSRDTKVRFGRPRNGQAFLLFLFEVLFPESLLSLCNSRGTFNTCVDLGLIRFGSLGLRWLILNGAHGLRRSFGLVHRRGNLAWLRVLDRRVPRHTRRPPRWLA